MKRAPAKRLAALLAAPLTLAAAGLLIAATPTTTEPSASGTKAEVLAPETLNVANALSNAFRDVSKHVLPAVVAIENRPDTSWQSASLPSTGPGNRSERTNLSDWKAP